VGEEVKVVVTLRPGHRQDETLARDILAFARTHLAGFKSPRTLAFVDETAAQPGRQDPARQGPGALLAGRARQI